MKRKWIAWAVCAALLAGFIGLTMALSGDKAVGYGLAGGTIAFTPDAQADITDMVWDGDGYLAAENAAYTMELTGTADLRLRHKATGRVWDAVPAGGADVNSKYGSSLVLRYHAGTTAETVLYSADHSVAKEQVRVYTIDGGVRVEYIFGDMGVEYLYPEMIAKPRMEQLLEKLDPDDAEYLKRRYTLYELSAFEGANRDILLAQYPRLQQEDLYVLTSMTTKGMKQRTDAIFRAAGYTEQDRLSDNAGEETAQTNPPVFRVGVQYRLTDTGFTASVEVADCAFYSEYPLTGITLLPYFDSFGPGDEGYLVLPSGSGALIDIGADKKAETAVSLPVYGADPVLTRSLDVTAAGCSLPVIGQYKNGGGYLCVLEEGSPQATICAETGGDFSAAYASHMVLDTASFQLAARNDTYLFAPRMTAGRLSMEFILLPEAAPDTAYSDMADLYRRRLIDDGLLPQRAAGGGAALLAEFVGVVNYDTLAGGVLPLNREYALTSFAEAGEIARTLAEQTGTANLHLLLTGFNEKGLSRQKPGQLNISRAAGGRQEYEALGAAMADAGIPLYTDLPFTLARPSPLDGYTPSRDAARTLNNTIVSLSMRDRQSDTFVRTACQLISPSRYEPLWQRYRQAGIVGGLGVSRLSSLLYGDYANGTAVTRGDAVRLAQEVLAGAADDRAVLGDGGNLYALPYLSFVNNLPMSSAGLNAFSRDIPFVQMVLHGRLPYAAAVMNGAGDPHGALLKAIETGSGLHYLLTANTFDRLFETDSAGLYNTHFAALQAQIVSQYAALREALDGLGGQTIRRHVYLSDAVTMTTYADGTRIVVNHGDQPFTQDGLHIGAREYRRLAAS